MKLVVGDGRRPTGARRTSPGVALLAGGRRRERVDVDHAVVVGVDAAAGRRAVGRRGRAGTRRRRRRRRRRASGRLPACGGGVAGVGLLRRCGRRPRAPMPSTTIAAMASGKPRLRSRPGRVLPPARAARATFLADEALPIGREAAYSPGGTPRRPRAADAGRPSAVSAGDAARRTAPRRRSATAAGEAHPSTKRRPGRAHGRRPRRGRRAGAAARRVNAVGVVGRHGDAGAGARSTVRATSVPGVDAGQDGPAGGEDRVQLRRHARPGQARACSGTTWMSPAASTSGSRSLGLDVDEAHVGAGRRPPPRASGRADPPPLITNTTSGSSAQAPRPPSSTQVERLRQADVAGVHHDGPVPEAVARAR